jgi:D-alanyl-D-alanine carboxypeptidase
MKIKLAICLLANFALLSFNNPYSINGVVAKGNSTEFSPFAKEFDIALFEKNIRKALDGKCVGYAYAITLNGQLKKKGAGGYAVLGKDLGTAGIPGLPQSPDKRMNIASVTKTITAATVLKILQADPNLSVDSKVEPFLPSTWAKGPGVNNLTFRKLLSQLSGMNNNVGGSTNIASLKKWIQDGVTRPENETLYINANLAIFRIIIPFMRMPQFKRAHFSLMAKVNEKKFDEQMSAQYKEEVNALVLKPMGILNADCKNIDPQPTRLYHTANQANGYMVGDWTLSAGGGGWFLSAVELARFLAHLRFNNQILLPEVRKMMDDGFLGWRKSSGSPTGDYGIYLAHGGGLNYGSGNKETGMASCIMNFPNGAQVALLINSLGTYGNKYTLLKEAFDNAWVFGKITP